MCGFAGIIDLKRLEINDDLDRRMSKALDSLYPRGPDQNGMLTDEYSYFVHARLSIIDITDNGRQPIHKYGKTIIYNGEIYNYKEVKKKLVKSGYNFFSNSDTEVLIAAWDKWGEDTLEHISGMYAFAIWDKSNKQLTLIRDPYGKKPLYYYVNNNIIAFASDLRSLENIIDCGDINPLAVESLFKYRFIYDPLSIYTNVHKLQPGHIIKFTSKNTELRKWYNLNSFSEGLTNKAIIQKKLRNYFDKAVKRRLVSDVDLGVFLSGGLDSSLIVSSLAEQGYSLPCFTMGFKGASDYYEERPQAKRLAKYFGMEHHSFEINEKNILKKIPEIFNASDEPFADTSAIPFYMLSSEVSSKVKVVLSGDGGDEVFGGYRKHLGERWSLFSNLIPKFIRNIIIELLIENKNTQYGEISRRIRRYLMNTTTDASLRQAGWIEQINGDSIKKLFGVNIENTKHLINLHRKSFKDPINAMLAADLGFTLAGDMLVKADRMSMANSLEIRSPFLDKELVEYTFSLPGKLKIGNFKGKKLLKESFKNRLPNWSTKLSKKGFEVPIADWLRSNLKSMVDDSCSKRSLEKLGIINHDLVNDWKQGLYSGKRDTSWQLWTLISYKQWLESKGKF
jgi:asparagine synthase (glutamine-hydrolysing)